MVLAKKLPEAADVTPVTRPDWIDASPASDEVVMSPSEFFQMMRGES